MSNKKITLIGPPGSGKGTQAQRIKERYSLPHLSSGEILRAEVAQKTDLGKEIEGYMAKGEIGPVELITDAILSYVMRTCPDAFILDGFPRTVYQAKKLSKDHELTGAFFIDVQENEIVKRITGRRTCSACSAIFHTEFNTPKNEGICDTCGGELFQRSDDNEETVLNRIRVYNDETKPVLDFYEELGLLNRIDGNRDSSEVFADIQAILD